MITVDDNCAVHCGEDSEWEWEEEEGGDSGSSGFAERERDELQMLRVDVQSPLL